MRLTAAQLQELKKETSRELGTRRGVYPGWIKSGKLKPEVATHRIKCQEQILELINERIALAEGNKDCADDWKGAPTVEIPEPEQQQQLI